MGLYKLCTISWLSQLAELLQVVGEMKVRFPILLGSAALVLGMQVVPANAEDKIQPFVNSQGKVVFTNLVNNAPFVAPATPTAVTQNSNVPSDGAPDSLHTLVNTISTNHGVDPDLVRAVIKTESNFNRWAVSKKGALGLMQLIPATGRRYGVRDFFDPQQNVDGGVRYLKFLLDKFKGNLDLSLAAYNAGENLVERLGRIPSIPETTNYVRKVRGIYKKPALVSVTKPASSPATVAAAAAPEPPRVFKVVDERGVVHFSNIGPPN